MVMDAANVQQNHILRTKLYRPPVPREALARPQLLARLDSYLSRQLILVHAPAGYGKSTLVSQWFETSEIPVAWLSLDEFDGDSRTFIAYVLAAVSEVYPNVGENTLSLLSSPQDLPHHVLADSLISDLEDLPGPLLLALDDFHVLADSSAEVVAERLVQYMPPGLNLVLTCRARPHLALSRLLMAGQMGEISVADLRFKEKEAATLISNLARRQVDEATIARLDQRTEGWVTALQLAGLALRGESERDLERLMEVEDANLLVGYMIEEVAQQIPAELIDFLRRTSILDRFSAELCEAVVHNGLAMPQPSHVSNAAATLRDINDANLFLIALDDQHSWYRYHHLFRDVLRRELALRASPEEIAGLHRRASAWYESEGMLNDAVQHAAMAGDHEAAAAIAERHYHLILNSSDPSKLATLYDLLPESTRERPGVLMMAAWIEHLGWRVRSAADYASRAEAILDSDSGRFSARQAHWLRSEAQTLRAQYAHFFGETTALETALDASEQFATERMFARGLAELYVTLGLQTRGRFADASAFVTERLEGSGHTSNARTHRLMLALCGIQLYEGNLTSLKAAGQTYQEMTLRKGDLLSLPWANWMLGVVAYERNELAEAEELFGDVVRWRHAANGKAVAEAYAGLFLTLLNSGRLDEAQEVLTRFRGHLVETRSLALMPQVESLSARLALARWRAQPGTLRSVPIYEPQSAIMPKLGFLEMPQATAARTLLAEGSPESLHKAVGLLMAVLNEVERTYELRRQVELHTLLALAWEGLGDETQALDHLRCALKQGEPEGYVRSIVDQGPNLAPLLSKLRDNGEYEGYIDNLLTVIADPSVVRGAALEILLTTREMEVLERLALRQSNKEIASDLYLSPLTVKRHTQSLFRKLGASNRREAVVFARQRGLSIEPFVTSRFKAVAP